MRIVNCRILILDGPGGYIIGHCFRILKLGKNYERFIFTIQVYWKRSLYNATLVLFTF